MPTFPQQLNFHLSVLNDSHYRGILNCTVYSLCSWVNLRFAGKLHRHTIKAAFVSVFRSLTFAFLVFHDSAPRHERLSVWTLALGCSICSCASHPCRYCYCSGTLLRSFILYTEVFGRPYYCYLETCIGATKKKSYKTSDCNVESCVNRCNLYCEFCSIWLYTFNVRLYICFVSCRV